MTDSSRPEFWDQRYAAKRTPWDFGGVPSALREYLAGEPVGRVLIPGCGSGYEVRAFARAGWHVDALDFSGEAVRSARARLGKADAHLVRHGDFFAENAWASFDMIYERTFLCSLPPDRWPAYAGQITRLLRTGGKLGGFFFLGPEPDPPPHPLGSAGIEALLGSGFLNVEDDPVTDSLPLFAGKERWQVWEKT